MQHKLFGTLSRSQEMRGWLFGCCLVGLVACGGAGPGHSHPRTQTPDAVEKREPVSAPQKVIKTERVSKREEFPLEERTVPEREHYEDPGFLRVEEVRPVECFRTGNQSETRLEGTEEFLLVVPWRASKKLDLRVTTSMDRIVEPNHVSYSYLSQVEPFRYVTQGYGSSSREIKSVEQGEQMDLQFEVWLPETAEQLEVRLRFPAFVYSEQERKDVEEKQYLRILVEPERCREWEP